MNFIIKIVDRLLGTIVLAANTDNPNPTRSNRTKPRWRNYRIAVLVALFASVPIGLATKYYRGPFDEWLNNSFGGAIYEIFWMLFLVALFPKLRPAIAAISVFVATSILEFLQLWHPAWLEAFRSTLLGRLLLGTTFNLWDFPYYVLGCFLGWLLLLALQKYILRKPN